MIPLATTTVTVTTPGAAEPYETPTYSTVVAAVRCHISSPSGTEREAGAGQAEQTYRAALDTLVEIGQNDQVIDNTTGVVYEVTWAEQRRGLGLDHTVVGLQRVRGLGG